MSQSALDTCFLHGEYVPLAGATIAVLDRGFIFGDAIYEVIPAPRGHIFALDDHLARLSRNLDAVGIKNPYTAQQWRTHLQQLVERNGAMHCLIYLQVTRGVAERNHAFPEAVEPTVFAMCRALPGDEDLILVSAIRLVDNRWERCDIKSTSLLANVLLRNTAIAAGAHEALLIREGRLTEGAASNVFVVRGGQILTPPLSHELLAGVTRAQLITVLRANGIDCQEVDIDGAALSEADEIWLTSSTRDLMCVNELDGRPIGDGQHYPLAKRAFELFQTLKP